MASYPRLTCTVCGRQVSSVYPEPGARHSTFDGRSYYYIRKHKTPDRAGYCAAYMVMTNVQALRR